MDDRGEANKGRYNQFAGIQDFPRDPSAPLEKKAGKHAYFRSLEIRLWLQCKVYFPLPSSCRYSSTIDR